MSELRLTLLGEGPTDQALLPILKWIVVECGVQVAVLENWADLGRLPRPASDLTGRMAQAVALFPCDILFVHRDADRAGLDQRVNEINTAAAEASALGALPPTLAVVPVRSTEAWFLLDEALIRAAAGNPNGTIALPMPRIGDVESLPAPKQTLESLLIAASGLGQRRRRHLETATATRRMANPADEFSALRALSAFLAVEAATREALVNLALV